MRSIHARLSGTAALAAIGGGTASALLSVVAAQKTSIAIVLGCLSPLPIMLATLSFGAVPGAIAAVIGALVLAGLELLKSGTFHPEQLGSTGIDVTVYAVSVALPSWWLALLVATTTLNAATVPAADSRKLGFLMASAVFFAFAGVATDFIATVLTHGGFHATIDSMVEIVEPFVRAEFGRGRTLPKGVTLHELAVATTWAQMPILAASTFLSLGFNIWLAARITDASGRLAIPLPDLPRSLRMPALWALLLAVALGLTFAGGLIAMLALILAGALLIAFTVQGLAVVHGLTRGKSYRLPMLIIVYLSLPWLLIVYTLLGLADAGFAFRDRPKLPDTGTP